MYLDGVAGQLALLHVENLPVDGVQRNDNALYELGNNQRADHKADRGGDYHYKHRNESVAEELLGVAGDYRSPVGPEDRRSRNDMISAVIGNSLNVGDVHVACNLLR